MGFATKFQFNAPTLLAASGFLLAMRWLLPLDAYFCRAMGDLAALVIFNSWNRWGRLHGFIPDAARLIGLERKERARTSLQGLGFMLLLGGWLIATVLPDGISHFFHLPTPTPQGLALAISIAVFLFILLVFAVLPVMTAVRNARTAVHNHRRSVSAFSKSVEDRLDELERLKRREMVTPEEYAAKRQEILQDL